MRVRGGKSCAVQCEHKLIVMTIGDIFIDLLSKQEMRYKSCLRRNNSPHENYVCLQPRRAESMAMIAGNMSKISTTY